MKYYKLREIGAETTWLYIVDDYNVIVEAYKKTDIDNISETYLSDIGQNIRLIYKNYCRKGYQWSILSKEEFFIEIL